MLFLSQIVPYPPHGGVLQRGYNLLRHAGQSAEIHLLAFVHPDVLPTDRLLAESRAALQSFCETVEYFPLWAKTSPLQKAVALGLSATSSSPFSVIAHRSAAFRTRVSEILGALPIDVIHADTLALAQFVDAGRATPRVLTHHNIESILMERRARVETGFLVRRFLQREAAKLQDAERRLSVQFDINIMMSEPDASALRRLSPAVRTTVVPNGVDTDYFKGDSTEERPALIYTGGMNMFANRDAVLHFLRDIWPTVRARVPAVRFFAVGQDPPLELRTIADADPQVVVTGYVDDIRPLVRQASVYVVPLRVGGGTRLKVLDAMSMGKALVSTSIGCEGIVVKAGDHLVVADDPESFAEATISLLGDRPRRQALGRAARALVEGTYAWPVISRQLFSAYDQAIEGARRVR